MGYQGGNRYGGGDFNSDRDRYGRDSDRWRNERDPRASRYGGDPYRGRDNRPSDYDPDNRGFFDRAGDEVRSWFGDEEAERRREYDERMNRRYGDPRFQSNRVGFFPPSGGGAHGYAPFTGTHADGQYPSPPNQTGYGPDFEYGGNRHDPHYHAWRNDRIRELDRDYTEYQQENRQRFNDEFGTWRNRRTEQRGFVTQVAEHMEVVGSDGAHVGTVDKTAGGRIILTKTDKDAGGIHHSIPSRWVDKVEGQKVILEKTADQAQTAWKAERDQQALFGDGQNGPGGSRYGADRSGSQNRYDYSARERDPNR